MNKILMSNEKKDFILDSDKYEFQNDGTFSLEVDSSTKDVYLAILENVQVVLNLLSKNTSLNFHIRILKNASFTFNQLIIEGNMNISVDLVEEGADFNLNYSVLSSNNSKNQIEVKHKASKTKSLLKNHGFSMNHANIILDVSAYIDRDANKCVSKQDNQIIENDNSLSQINPNLYIENYNVEASHSAYVGEFKENELFYLMSRGLDLETSKFLLLKSFLIGSFDLEEKVQEQYYHEMIKYFNKEV